MRLLRERHWVGKVPWGVGMYAVGDFFDMPRREATSVEERFRQYDEADRARVCHNTEKLFDAGAYRLRLTLSHAWGRVFALVEVLSLPTLGWARLTEDFHDVKGERPRAAPCDRPSPNAAAVEQGLLDLAVMLLDGA